MSNVKIERAPGAPSCQLWDGRRAPPLPGDPPLEVAVENAADLLERAPSEWIVGAEDRKRVDAEIKRRADAAKKGKE